MTTTTRPPAQGQQSDLPIDQVLHSDALTALQSLPSNSVDAICIDPPCGISFMSKSWDNFSGKAVKDRSQEREQAGTEGKWLEGRGTLPYGFSPSTGHSMQERENFIVFLQEIMTEALRVIKPGGHAFVWALPRTSHWTTMAIENAGFEIREKHYHLFGSGFPKAANISKMIDQKLGIEREIVGIDKDFLKRNPHKAPIDNTYNKTHRDGIEAAVLTSPASPEAQKWDGWFSSTKPACEEWILCRKPLSEPTIAENVLKWGVGSLNIGATRVPGMVPQVVQGITHRSIENSAIYGAGKDVRKEKTLSNPHHAGRYPSNVTFSHSLFCTNNVCSQDYPVLALEQQSGMRSSGAKVQKVGDNVNKGIYSSARRTFDAEYQSNTGTAARFYHCFPPASLSSEQDVPFFYTPKSSTSERNAGIPKKIDGGLFEEYEGEGMEHSAVHRYGAGVGEGKHPELPAIEQNTHPTIKSQSLLKFLITLITPPNGIVLDFFAGSGSTGVAAIGLGMHCILIEQSDTQEEPYVSIASSRLQHALNKRSRRLDNVAE